MQQLLHVIIDIENLEILKFTIPNPILIPPKAIVFNCNWEDYIKDKQAVKALYKFQETNDFIVQHLNIYLSKTKSEVTILLLPQ